MAFKIAITAGHFMGTPGKRCAKAIDPNETREWWLNNRVVSRVINGLKAYDGYALLRTDDPSGKTEVTLQQRTDKANAFGADIYVSIHHNAGGGSGIMVYTYTHVDERTKRLQNVVYDCLIEATGNKGNRASPKTQADLHECRETMMPAVLCECGFMDNKTDTPRILTDDYATKLAQGLIKAITQFGALQKKPVAIPKPVPSPATPSNGIQVGDVVTYKGRLYGDSYGGNPGSTVTGTYVVTKVVSGRKYGVHLGQSGWAAAEDCTVVKGATPAAASPVLAEGDRVKLLSSAITYVDGKTKIPAFAKAWTLYVRQLSDGKVLVSPYKTGAVTGWVYAKDVMKV